MARRSFLPVVGVIENMSAFVCDHGESYALFGSGGGEALAAEIEVPLLGQVPLEPAVAAGNDAGEPVVARAATARPPTCSARSPSRSPPRWRPRSGSPRSTWPGCSARLLDAVEAAFSPKR